MLRARIEKLSSYVVIACVIIILQFTVSFQSFGDGAIQIYRCKLYARNFNFIKRQNHVSSHAARTWIVY